MNDYTLITPIEASKLLNVTVQAIYKAVERNILTRIVTIGNTKMLIKEQVLLFSDKKQIKFSKLSEEERNLWNKYNNLISTLLSNNNQNDTTEIEIDPQELIRALLEGNNKISFSKKPSQL